MEKTFGAFFQVVGGNEGSKCHYPTRLDTYGCGCSHLPLAKKKEYISRLTGFEEITVCEDEAYAYWRDHFNHNPDDCCNLRRTEQNGSCSKENR